MWWVEALMVWRRVGSYTTMSASRPTPTAPFCGSPNMRAGAAEITSPHRFGVRRPVTTPPECIRFTRSSTPGRPFGTLRKSPMPISFWPWKSNGQWSVETTCRSSWRRPSQRSSAWSAGRSGGEQTNFAPLKPLPMSSSERNRYCGQVSAKAGSPSSRARGPPVGGLALEDRRARDAVVVRIGLAGGEGLSRHHVDGEAVLGVHHDQPAVGRGLLHRPEDGPVIGEEDAGVGGEQLEAGDPLVDQGVHLGQHVVADVADDHVEGVVDAGVAIGLGMPGVEPVAERLATRLDREVDDRGRPAEGRGPGAGLERVLGE